MTGRREPHLEWSLLGLRQQAKPGDEVELLVIDLHGRTPEALGYEPGGPIARVRVVEPKPNPWQGRHRLTGRDWWATSNARNTAIVLADTDFLVFVDDRAWLGPRWLEVVREYELRRDAVVVGSYDKHEDGRLTRDHRRGMYPSGLRGCTGGWLFGCSFAAPLEWLLEVNGLEEGCDGLSGEDYILGLMLTNAGRRLDFRPHLYVRQDRSTSAEHGIALIDKGATPKDKSHAALARFGRRRRTELTPDLRALRAHVRAGGDWPAVDPETRDWYDGERVADARMPG